VLALHRRLGFCPRGRLCERFRLCERLGLRGALRLCEGLGPCGRRDLDWGIGRYNLGYCFGFLPFLRSVLWFRI
jgi:hypothetical protein